MAKPVLTPKKILKCGSPEYIIERVKSCTTLSASACFAFTGTSLTDVKTSISTEQYLQVITSTDFPSAVGFSLDSRLSGWSLAQSLGVFLFLPDQF